MGSEITLEPRWSFNLRHRTSKEKSISGDTRFFFLAKTTYRPKWFAVTNYDPFMIHNGVTQVPAIGYRGHLGNHFTYEDGVGICCGYTFNASGSLRHKAP